MVARFDGFVGAREALLGEPIPRPRASSASDGSFELAIPSSSGHVELDDLHFALVGRVRRKPDALDELVVAPAVRVAGIVVDEHGDPIEGADVCVVNSVSQLAFVTSDASVEHPSEPSARSDALGRFAIEKAARCADTRVQATALHFDAASIALTSDATDELRLMLRRIDRSARPSIHGRVLDDAGTPLADVDVRYGQDSAVSDQHGAFEVHTSIGFGVDRALTAFKPGLRPARVERFDRGAWEAAEASGGVTLALGAALAPIRGRVLDADGRLCVGWSVDLIGAQPFGSSADTSIEHFVSGRGDDERRTDREGRFELGGLFDHPYRVRAYDRRSMISMISDEARPGDSNVELRVPSDACYPSVRGRVLSKRGLPVADVAVAFGLELGSNEGLSTSIWSPPVATNRDGRFELAHVPRTGARIGTTNDGVQGPSVAIGRDADRHELLLEVELQVRVRLDATRFPTADRALLLDELGQKLTAVSHFVDRSSGNDEVARAGDGFPRFDVSDRARTLVLCSGPTELARVALDLRFGEVNTITP